MPKHEILVMIAVAVVVSSAFVGVGYGLDYSGTSTNSENVLNAVYMEFELNGEKSAAFEFDSITYYRDRSADGTLHYKSYETESRQPLSLLLHSYGTSDEVVTVAQAKLKEDYPALGQVLLRIYEDQECESDPREITLTTEYTEIPDGFTTGYEYWCKLIVTLGTTYLEDVPTGSFKFDVVFQAEATA